MDKYTATEQAYKHGYEKGYEAGRPKWIPVTERLPELQEMQIYDDDGSVYVTHVSDTVLAYTKYGQSVVVFREVWEGRESWVDDGGSCYTVTHWMLLPEPPKEGE